MDLGCAAGPDLLQWLDEVWQVLAGKFPTEPKHQLCYLAHGGESLGNLAGSLKGDFGKSDSTAFIVFRQVRYRSCALQPERGKPSSLRNQLRFAAAARGSEGGRKQKYLLRSSNSTN